jgi:hypothetical protein
MVPFYRRSEKSSASNPGRREIARQAHWGAALSKQKKQAAQGEALSGLVGEVLRGGG